MTGRPPSSLVPDRSGPIGADLTFDVIDLVDDDDDDNDDAGSVEAEIDVDLPERQRRPEPAVRLTHPQKVIEQARKRKRERETRRREAREEAERQRQRRLQEEEAAAARAQRTQSGINFILIDDSSDEEEAEREATTSGNAASVPARRRGRPRRGPGQGQTSRKAPGPPWDESDAPYLSERDFNYDLTHEDAAQLQERMFREAAERLRATAFVALGANGAQVLARPLINIFEQFPDHWQWRDPYACLGLPPNASLALIKAHYRALARRYHPDKSKQDTARKFHGITMAYRRLSLIYESES